MLGLDNPIHLVFLLVLLLLVFGAKRLPEMGRSLGSGLRGFKESLTSDDAVPAERTPLSETVPAVVPAAQPIVAVHHEEPTSDAVGVGR